MRLKINMVSKLIVIFKQLLILNYKQSKFKESILLV